MQIGSTLHGNESMDSNVIFIHDSLAVFRKCSMVGFNHKDFFFFLQKHWYHIVCTLQMPGNGAKPIPSYDMPLTL